MATIEEIREDKKKAEVEYGEAKKKLNDWEEKENKGKWLNELGMKLFNEEWKDGGEKKKWEDKVKELEEEKTSLVKDKDDWKGQVEEWGEALRKFVGGGEGNEQIA